MTSLDGMETSGRKIGDEHNLVALQIAVLIFVFATQSESEKQGEHVELRQTGCLSEQSAFDRHALAPEMQIMRSPSIVVGNIAAVF